MAALEALGVMVYVVAWGVQAEGANTHLSLPQALDDNNIPYGSGNNDACANVGVHK
jgi:hypothetical protein